MRAFAASLVAALLVVAGPALADELAERVRDLYRPYEKEAADVPSAAEAIRPLATKRLGALLDRDDACAKRNGICNLGHDVIVNGQDYKIGKVEVAPAAIQGDKASVTVRFLNMGGRFQSRYDFVREAGAWRLDDIEALQPKEYRWRLTTLLAPKSKRKER